MIDTSFLDQLNRFSLIVNKRVTSNYAGEKRSIAEGRGLVFKDHRIYAPGDDIKLIDWRVYARTDDLYVKRYEEERNLSVHIILDCSGSMNFGRRVKKFEYASMIGIGFAYLALKENEKFQYSTFSETLQTFRPRRGMNQLASMLQHLNSVKMEGHSKLYDSMMKYKRNLKSSSLIIIISDFLIATEEIKSALYVFGDHEIKVIQVLDPIETDFGLDGDFKLKDSETSDILKTHVSPRLKMEYRDKMANHVAEIKKTCAKLNINFFTITTDTPVFDAFYEILK